MLNFPPLPFPFQNCPYPSAAGASGENPFICQLNLVCLCCSSAPTGIIPFSTMLEYLVARLCRSRPSYLDFPLPATVSLQFSWCGLGDHIDGKYWHAASILERSNDLSLRRLPHEHLKKCLIPRYECSGFYESLRNRMDQDHPPAVI